MAKVALVLDLPGAQGVATGVALAERGYRPVPLYNAVPMPADWFFRHEGSHIPSSYRPEAAVNILPIIDALKSGAERLARVNLPVDAPPAFLLDYSRQGDFRTMKPNDFDNRSICFTTDFPSANFLAAHGIQCVLLVQQSASEAQRDLAHTLRRWQDGGLILQRLRLDSDEKPERFTVPTPPWYAAMFQRALASLGLRRDPGGGFGGWVPDPRAGG